MKNRASFRQRILYCGLTAEEYQTVKPLIAHRNKYTFNLASLAVAAFGAVFLLIQLFAGNRSILFPYLFLTAGGAAAVAMRGAVDRASDDDATYLCYFPIMLLLAYSIILGGMPTNHDVPYTSLIVFLAVMPLTVSDKPVRMDALIICTSVISLLCSCMLKSRDAFFTDVLNVLAFSFLSMFLYSLISNRTVHELYKGLHYNKIQSSLINNMALVIEERDESTGNHINNVVTYVDQIIRGMRSDGRYSSCPESFYEYVRLTAPLHDIGKIRIPDGILNKPGKLTPEEFEIMKKHTVYGSEILVRFSENMGMEEHQGIAVNIAAFHHERYDGKGYPSGLKGEEIPLEARIVALADVYDALISERVYKKAFSKEESVRIIAEGRGTQFDPALTDIFLRSLA